MYVQTDEFAKHYAKIYLFFATGVQLIYNPFSQMVSQQELYSQFHLSLQSDPIAHGVLIST